VGYGLARGSKGMDKVCIYIILYTYIYTLKYNIYIYFTYVCADKTPRPGGEGRTRRDDKAEGAAVFHWNSAHSYAPTNRTTRRDGGGREVLRGSVDWLVYAAGGVGGWAYRTFVCARLFPVPSRKRKTSHTCINVLKGSVCVC